MVRNMDLARKLMLAMEKQPYTGSHHRVDLDGANEGEISYHVMLLNEAGLIAAKERGLDLEVEWQPLRLTWEGHEFLGNVQDETRWKQTLGVVRSRTGGLAFEVVKQVAGQLAKSAVSGLTGMP